MTASAPIRIETGPVQLENMPPAALATRTRPEAIPPNAAPSANGVSSEASANSVSILLSSRADMAAERSA